VHNPANSNDISYLCGFNDDTIWPLSEQQRLLHAKPALDQTRVVFAAMLEHSPTFLSFS